MGIEELCAGAVCAQMAGVQRIFLVFDERSSCAVTEEDAGGTVIVVGDLGQALICHHQGIAHGGVCFQKTVRRVHSIDKAGTSGIHVKAGSIGCAGLPLDDAGHRRRAVLRRNGSVDQQTDLQRINACRLDGTLGSLCAHIPGGFSVGDVACADTGSGSDPFVVGLDDLCHIFIGHLKCRRIAPCS